MTDFDNRPAHIDPYCLSREQSIYQHCIATAKYAAELLASVDLDAIGEIVGDLHDMGKDCDNFESYLRKAVSGLFTAKAYPHSRGGARYLLEQDGDMLKQLCYEVMANVIVSHHGVHDMLQDSDTVQYYNDTFRYDELMPYDDMKDFPTHFSLDFKSAETQFQYWLGRTVDTYRDSNERDIEVNLQLGLLFRLILSALKTADHRSTIEFQYQLSLDVVAPDWDGVYQHVISKYGEPDSEINRSRQRISDLCDAFGRTHQSGIYELNVPTGAGKTMSSLRLATSAIVHSGKSRIFFVMPLLSIIEQNAAEIKKTVQMSDIVHESYSSAVRDDDTDRYQQMVSDTWNAPIIVTSLVQFLESIYGNRSRNIKRFAALCNSVIVIDEVQSVPRKLISLFNAAMNFLSETCHCLIVLCSATQPNFGMHKIPLHLSSNKDIVPFETDLMKPFERTKFEMVGTVRGLTQDEISEFVISHLNHNMLVVCNTRRTAYGLYKTIQSSGVSTVYLSSNFCPAHRRQVMEQLKQMLDNGDKVICVSTQVIEAGVDISFESAVRILGGLDNVIQTSGRVNRHGEYQAIQTVYMMFLRDESFGSMKELSAARKAMMRVVSENAMTQAAYYQALQAEYGRAGADYPVDNTTLVDLLSVNQYLSQRLTDKSRYQMHQMFKTAWNAFHVLDDNTVSVVVPYGNAMVIASALVSDRAKRDPKYYRQLEQLLSEYCVSMYPQEVDRLREQGGIISLNDMLLLRNQYYDDEVGILREEWSK